MNLSELNYDQKLQLKQHILTDRQYSVSWMELCEADSLVSDQELDDTFGGVIFSEDDFF